jgi:hypothetical protein
MKVIWKFPVGPGRFSVEIPSGATFLSVQTQLGRPQMWFMCDPHAIPRDRWFRVQPTGLEFDFEEKYLGTFQLEGGELVFHLFEERP